MRHHSDVTVRDAVEYAAAMVAQCRTTQKECLISLLQNLESVEMNFPHLLKSLQAEIQTRLETGGWSTDSNLLPAKPGGAPELYPARQ